MFNIKCVINKKQYGKLHHGGGTSKKMEQLQWFSHKRLDVQETIKQQNHKHKKTLMPKGSKTANLYCHIKQKHLAEYKESQRSCDESSTAFVN